MKRIVVAIAMCLSLVLGATAYTASPAAANDGSDVHCWVGDYYAYSQFWYDNVHRGCGPARGSERRIASWRSAGPPGTELP